MQTARPISRSDQPDPGVLLDQVASIIADIAALELASERDIHAAAPAQRESVRNLIHYIALRRHDLRRLQRDLAALGLSSLGRSESHVLATLQAVANALAALGAVPPPTVPQSLISISQGDRLLKRNTLELLGAAPARRDVRIMVTMPTEAADDHNLIAQLVDRGMDIARINCAHDDPGIWLRMVAGLRAHAGSACRLFMDVEGPKLRTGPITDGPRVISWNPPRSPLGTILRPALIRIVPTGAVLSASASPLADCTLQLPADFVAALRPGANITFTDHPGRSRSLLVTESISYGVLAQSSHSAYITPGTEFHADRPARLRCAIHEIPPGIGVIELRSGDHLLLTADQSPGEAAVRDAAGLVISPARISLSPPRIFQDLRPGHRVMLDDGKAEGIVERVEPASALLHITRCRSGVMKLASRKGINLPDTDLGLPPLGDDDLAHLEFIARHADLVGFSFVQRPEDVRLFREALARVGRPEIGLVLKIETAPAFARLPELLLSAMESGPVGVMIARGDLATQIGYDRLAEVQEEILWICEAAHVPVIWATQVLETLAKKGLPSRSEITDAAVAERSECVMLNKGPFIADALSLLDDILHRMAGHQDKKRSMLRPLSVALRFPAH